MSEDEAPAGPVVLPVTFSGPDCRAMATAFTALALQNGFNAVMPGELTVVSLLFDKAPGSAELWALRELARSLGSGADEAEEEKPCAN